MGNTFIKLHTHTPHSYDCKHQGPAQAVARALTPLFLEPALLRRIWPGERVVGGMRVCRQLRRDLVVYCTGVVLVPKAGATSLVGVNESSVSKDLGRLPEHVKVTLTREEREWAMTLAGVLGECRALAHRDLSGSGIGLEGAEKLAGVLGKCDALEHLDLSQNEI
eukprot:705956-Rhodomonas_salina.1